MMLTDESSTLLCSVLRTRYPVVNAEPGLQELLEAGFIQVLDDGYFCITRAGKDALDDLFQSRQVVDEAHLKGYNAGCRVEREIIIGQLAACVEAARPNVLTIFDAIRVIQARDRR